MNYDLLDAILSRAAVPIRLRLARRFPVKFAQVDRQELESQLLALPIVQTWLARFTRNTGPVDLHGSKPTQFENVIGKLVDLGVRAGMPVLDEKTAPYLRWLEAMEQGSLPSWERVTWSGWYRSMVANLLAYAGYRTESVRRTMARRLELMAAFARQRNFDLYVDPAPYGKAPRGFHNKPLLDPALYPGDQCVLPMIYDLVGMSAFGYTGLVENADEKIEVVLRYLLDPRYQSAHPGSSLCWVNKRWYAVGWDVCLPGFFGLEKVSETEWGQFLQRLLWLARFWSVRAHPWFQHALTHLQTFQTAGGWYCFSTQYFPEKASGYWVSAAYCALEPGRRTPELLEAESTLRMMELLDGG
jgi:hypothetical protein